MSAHIDVICLSAISSTPENAVGFGGGFVVVVAVGVEWLSWSVGLGVLENEDWCLFND